MSNEFKQSEFIYSLVLGLVDGSWHGENLRPLDQFSKNAKNLPIVEV